MRTMSLINLINRMEPENCITHFFGNNFYHALSLSLSVICVCEISTQHRLL